MTITDALQNSVWSPLKLAFKPNCRTDLQSSLLLFCSSYFPYYLPLLDFYTCRLPCFESSLSLPSLVPPIWRHTWLNAQIDFSTPINAFHNWNLISQMELIKNFLWLISLYSLAHEDLKKWRPHLTLLSLVSLTPSTVLAQFRHSFNI
jgi:hypothetical protein